MFWRIFTVTIGIIVSAIIMFSFMSKSNELDINSKEFKEKFEMDHGVVIDVRTREEYEAGHLKITDAQYNWLDGEFHDAVDGMDKNQTYYLYCRSGNRSGQAARMMKERGFDNVYNVGGFDDLANSGFEAE